MPKTTQPRLKKTNEFEEFNLNIYVSHGENIPIREESNFYSLKDNILKNLESANVKAREHFERITNLRDQNLDLESTIGVLSYVDIKLIINNK